MKYLLFFLLCLPAMAQTVEVSGGYSYLTKFQMHGWQASAAYNPTSYAGLAFDTNGQYETNNKLHGFYAGPRFTWRQDKVNFYGHVMLGALRNDWSYQTITTGTPQTMHAHSTAFSSKAGAGVDIRLSDRVSWRNQVDYLFRSPQPVQLSTGFAFHF